MKVLLFGATGMVGQGVLRECLLSPDVELVQTVGRKPSPVEHSKLGQLVHADLSDYAPVESSLAGFDACFYSVGITSVGTPQAEYERVTYSLAAAAAQTLARLNPDMVFIFVSAAGADSSETGRFFWARVKGRAENAILRLPFRASYVFRPSLIQPLHGIQSRTRIYRYIYGTLAPVLPALRRAFPGHIVTTEEIGRAMIAVSMHGAPKRILENKDIAAAAAGPKHTVAVSS